VWLNYGFLTVFLRAFHRTPRRIISREQLFAGNRESLARTFFSRESILVWVIATFRRRRKSFQALRTDGKFPQLHWIEFRFPTEAEAFLRLTEGGR
jgi:hypothetical protein